MPVISSDSYLIEEHSEHDLVPFREIEEADAALQPRQDAAASIVEQLLINKEVAAAALLFATAAAANVVSIAASAKWDYTTTTQPIDAIDTGMFTLPKEIGKAPNTAVTGNDVWKVLKNHDDILDRIKYSQKGIVTQDLVAALLDLDNLYVGKAVKMTSQEGSASEGTAYIWGKNLLLTYVQPRPSKKALTHAYQFVKRGSSVQVKEWEDTDSASMKIEGSLFYDMKIVSSLCGYLMIDCVA
jgi:hypothetical protein